MDCKNKLYSASTQVLIVGFLAFCGPGLFNALSGLGGAGSADPKVGAIMNATLYSFFTVVGYFSGVFFNMLGPKPLFLFGGLTYAIYAICAYFSDKGYWVGAIGGSVLGIGAGLFWTAQGAIMMAYSTPDQKGAFIRNFWIIFNLGGVFGGILSMALNWNTLGGGANPSSYFTFIALMIIGSISSIFLLVDPNKVTKKDGSPVVFEKATGAKEEIVAAVKAITDPFVIKMMLFFFASNWFYTYEFQGYNSMLFNVRTRGLNSGLFWGAQMLGATLTGFITDKKGWTMRKRGVYAFSWNMVNLAVAWGSAFIVNYTVKCGTDGGKGWDKGEGVCGFDLQDSNFVGLVIVFMLMGMQDAVFQSFCYWVMSAAAGNSITRNVKYAACYKGIQSLGATIAWATDLITSFKYGQQLYVGTILSVIASVPTYFALDHIIEPEDYEEEKHHADEENTSSSYETSSESSTS
ncbi:MAG: hypothetical protein KVP17_000482 [Porospora cf. gigantea B]|uniref:uncharacterized protein n=1 Tax=Porospora cf. gigantea B TaxID=2853592 RepID=UPI0035718258|nr:MAG: hypothetical protein KVP17_000482 [Porospora cf. gigantea B]